MRCLGVENEVVKLRRVTFDLSILLHSKRSIADLAIKVRNFVLCFYGLAGGRYLDGTTIYKENEMFLKIKIKGEFHLLIVTELILLYWD